MYNQLKIGFSNMKSSILFYISVIFFITIGVSYAIIKMVPLGVSGSLGFIRTIGDTSFMFYLSIFAAYFIGNDFTNRTIQNEVKLGYSRASIILTRSMVVLPTLALFHLVYVFSTVISLVIFNGFGSEVSPLAMLIQSILVVLQVMAIQCFVVLIVFLCKRATLGIVASVTITFVTCNLLRNFLGQDDFYFSITSFYRIMMKFQDLSVNEVIVSFISAIVTPVVVFALTCMIFQKSELK